VGVGKSYLLYLLAAELRTKRQYRVTYIHDCAAWKCDPLGYILRELVTTFYDDLNISGKNIIEWCRIANKTDLLILIEKLLMYTLKNQLEWFFICDQLDALYSRKNVAREFPYNLISELSRRRGKHVRVIVSASANNEGYPTKMTTWFKHHLPTHHYDDDEFKIWCANVPLANNSLVDPDSAAAADALDWSGKFSIHILEFKCPSCHN
jgi:hypothetical protein